MTARITSDDLARDVTGAEALISRHKENKAEIDARQKDFTKFSQTGHKLISDGHFLSDEIQEKINHLNHNLDSLLETWEQRRVLYEQNLDVQQLKRDMEQLEAWLSGREPVLKDSNLGDSIDAVEELLRKHEDFEKTVYAQEDKFNAIKRLTLVGNLIISISL
jgi:spectrin beta